MTHTLTLSDSERLHIMQLLSEDVETCETVLRKDIDVLTEEERRAIYENITENNNIYLRLASMA